MKRLPLRRACGFGGTRSARRLTLTEDWSEIIRAFGLIDNGFHYPPHYNIAPTQDIVANEKGTIRTQGKRNCTETRKRNRFVFQRHLGQNRIDSAAHSDEETQVVRIRGLIRHLDIGRWQAESQ